MTVVDVAGGRVLPNQTVVVVDRWIRAVGSARNTQVLAGARVIDASGKSLIPGLWDMEAYPDYDGGGIKTEDDLQPRFNLMIANGVTGYRQLHPKRPGITTDSMLDWRRKIAAGTWVGPRIVFGAASSRALIPPWRTTAAFTSRPRRALAR